MNRLAQITALSASIDTTLNEFALAANPAGEYPWEQAQRERRNRRVVGAAVGTAAVGAGVYGAKKLHGAVMNRAAEAAMGPVRPWEAYKSVAQEGVDKLKGAVGNSRVGQYGKNLAGGYQQARKGAMVMGKATGGKGMLGAGIAALRKVKFTRADQIIALEAKMDEALAEFAMKDDPRDDEKAAKIAGRFANKKAAAATTGGILAGGAIIADKAIMNRAKKKYGFPTTRATAYGEGVTDAMKAGKRMMKRGMVQAKYHAEPVVRKIKGVMGLRKVAGLLK
jgi:hypothetical protein